MNIDFICNIDKETITSDMDSYDVYLNITGDFQVRLDGRVFYQDEGHSVVEFVVQLCRWSNTSITKTFLFVSLEDEGALLEITYKNNKFNIESNRGLFMPTSFISTESLVLAVEKYIHYVERELADYGYCLQTYVDDDNLQSTL